MVNMKDYDYEKWRTIRLGLILLFVFAVIAFSIMFPHYYISYPAMPVMQPLLFGFIWLILIIVIMFMFAWVVSAIFRSGPLGKSEAERILRKRYARGEITYKQYREMINKLRK